MSREDRRRRARPSAPAVAIHVETLALDGSGARSAEIREGVERELARLLAGEPTPGRLARWDGAAAVEGGRLADTAAAAPSGLGREIARAVYGGLRR